MNQPFDWKNFHQLFERHFPDGKKAPWETQLDLSWIDKHIRETLEKSLSGQSAPSTPSRISTETIDIHNYVIVKAPISEEQASNLRVRLSSRQMRFIAGNKQPIEEIMLPSRVDPGNSKAIYKKGVLEIRMPKSESQERFYPLDIRFMD